MLGRGEAEAGLTPFPLFLSSCLFLPFRSLPLPCTPTPPSFQADGRKVLRSSLREFLCSEAMYHLVG